MNERARSRLIQLFLLASITSAILYWRFPDFFQHGNHWVIEPWGDGYQAYHAFLYHVEHDSTYSHYEGMNYPFGDHVIPGNCQPILGNVLKLLGLEDYALGVMHFSMLVSILLCAVFLFLILARLGLPAWVSIPAAIGITLLAPQIHRMSTHYGLAHPEVIPLVFYCLLRWEEREDWRWALALGLVNWIYPQIHFYFFAIIAFAITGYWGFRWICRRDWKRLPKYAAHYALAVILPFIYFNWSMNWGDPVTDRSALPWGFFNYRAYPGGILTSPFEPHWKWLGEQVLRIKSYDFEARNYIGLTAMVGLATLLTGLVKRRFHRSILFPPPKTRSDGGDSSIPPTPQRGLGSSLTPISGVVRPNEASPVSTSWFQYTLLSATAILIFAFGIPFILPGLEDWLNYTGPIRQFRSIGRFAWVFYYAANILAFFVIYRSLGKKSWVMVFPLLLLLFEAYWYLREKDLRLDPIEDYEPGNRFTDIREINYDHYQALLPIPYFNLGSDQFWWDISGLVAQKSETVSIQTGLPLSGSHLTRTSRSQTLKQLQLVTEPYRLPAILADFPNEKPLLMAWDSIRHHQFGQDFLHLLDGALLLYEKKEFRLYELPLESFRERLDTRIATIRTRMEKDSLYERDGWQLSDSSAAFVFQSFDHQKSANAYLGGGGFQGKMSDWNILFEGPLPAGEQKELVVSAWMFIDADLNARTDMEIQVFDPQSGTIKQSWHQQVRERVKVFDSNGWALIEWPINLEQTGLQIRWIFQNTTLGQQPIYLDELLIRPIGVDLYKNLGTSIWHNNRHY